MAAATLDIGFAGTRDKKTNALRIFYAIPHLICVGALNGFNEALAVIQWVLVLFTGKRNRGIWDLQRGVLDWQVRAYAYVGLMYDTYPNFGFERKAEPVTFGLEYEETANRLTCILRPIWAIPAFIVLVVIGIGAWFVTIVSWFAIVFTGEQSQGRFDFLLRFHRFSINCTAYLTLTIDTYPKFV
jgi:hypothetical protein